MWDLDSLAWTCEHVWGVGLLNLDDGYKEGGITERLQIHDQSPKSHNSGTFSWD